MSNENSGHKLVEKATAAFRHAALDVIEIARRTGTPVIVWEDGQIVHWTPDEAERRLAQKLGAQGGAASAPGFTSAARSVAVIPPSPGLGCGGPKNDS